MTLPTYTSSGTAITTTSYVPPAPPQPYLPNALWTLPVATLSDLNAVATAPADQQAQVAADNEPLRIVYGRTRIGAQIADVLTYQNKLVLIAVWCEGEIEAVESVEINDAAAPSGVTVTSYTGTAGQTANATLIAAYASHGITYADTLAGVAYSVVVVAAGAVDGFPGASAIIRGRKVYDPRSTLTAYSDNPALCLADFVESTTYGMARDVNWASVETVADFADELCGSEKRRLVGLCIDYPAPCARWIEALRTYAGCWLSQEGSEILLIKDDTAASTFTFTDANIVAGSLRLKKRGVQQVPTVVEVRWTDTTITPWAEKPAIAKLGGVDEGTTPRRESQVSLPGIQRYSQAYREAVERLNKLNTSDLSCEFATFDEALAVQIGDVVTVTHSIGLAAKLMRVTGIAALEPGRWRITAVEYDPAAYSDTVSAEPSYSDTDLPNPAEPPALAGLTAVEEVYQLDNGTYSSRIKMAWDTPDYSYLRDYRVEVYRLGELIATATPREAIWRSGPVQEGIEYVCKVASISTIGTVGDWAQYNVTPLGKSLIPGDVPSLTIFEAGGRVYGTAGKAIDIDIIRYEWRYWPVGGLWATGIVIDEADSLRLVVDTIPEGTWVVGVKAVDSVRQTSANAKTATVVVTSDSNSFLVDAYESDTPALTNMAAYTLHPTDPNTYYITEDGVAWGTKFPAAMSTYTNPIGSYHNSVTSTWLGEAEEFGLLLSGQWNGEAVVADVSGSHASSMGFSTDGSAYSYLDGLSHKANARFARLKHEALTTSTMKVTVPGQTIRLNAVPREENYSGTSSASGPVTAHMENEYIATKKITITPVSATAVSASPDNIGLDAPNPADKHANITITDTYTTVLSAAAGGWAHVRGRHSLPTTGKWYWESKVNAVGTTVFAAGVCSRTIALLNAYLDTASMFYFSNGLRYPGGIAYGASYADNDVIGIAYDADAGTITFYKTNVSQGEITGLTGEKFLSVAHNFTNSSVTLRINRSDFSYTPPTGYAALPYGFDVGVFDASGTRVAREFLANFQGV